jgi:hypothetical protein
MMIPGMSISSYRKYTIIFDIIGLILFTAVTVFGFCVFYLDLPSNKEGRALTFFVLSGCGLVLYTVALIYQIRKCRAERNQYLPLQ